MIVKDFKAEHFPDPGALNALLQPSRVNRWWNLLGRMQLNGKLQFIGVFLVFVCLGTLTMFVVEGAGKDSPFRDIFNAFWFTVVTITTVGYGDIAPTGSVGRFFAMLEILVGIGLVGVITGGITSILVEGNRRRALGLVPIRHIRDHIVVCGWKRDIRNILLGILDTNRWLSAHDLVLITTRSPGDVGELKRERRLRGLHYIYGNPAARGVLEMARVAEARRVIILADEAEEGRGGDPDSKTVLAATAVEAVSSQVYTCTEIIKPHFVPYLRPAGVEEIVLGARNGHALIVAASLGDGLANMVTRFFPEKGQQMRILPIPPLLIGASYAEVSQHAMDRGYLPLGLLENTGKLHDRKKDRIDEALREPNYIKAIQTLRSAAYVESNVPRFIPDGETPVPAHSNLMVLLPYGGSMGKGAKGGPSEAPTTEHVEAALASAELAVLKRKKRERIVICGWKTEMAALLERMLKAHKALGRPLAGVTILGTLPDGEREKIAAHKDLKKVKVVIGEPTDPTTLIKAGVERADRLMVITNPIAEASSEGADARNVMISVAVNEINPAAYKCVEIFNPALADHLQVAHVEEAIYTRGFQRLMLVQASLGTGLSSAIGELLNPENSLLRVVDIPKPLARRPYSEIRNAMNTRGVEIIGVVEDSGNSFTHKKQYLHMAQTQARVKTAVEQLLMLKSLQSNHPVLNPPPDYVPGPYGRAVLINSGEKP